MEVIRVVGTAEWDLLVAWDLMEVDLWTALLLATLDLTATPTEILAPESKAGPELGEAPPPEPGLDKTPDPATEPVPAMPLCPPGPDPRPLGPLHVP